MRFSPGTPQAAQTAYRSAIPFVAWLVTCYLGGFIADSVIYRYYSTRPFVVRRVFQTLTLLLPALFLMLLAVHADSVEMSQLFLTLAVGTQSLYTSGYVPVMMDMGGEYAGCVVSLSNTVATIPGIVGVYLTGAILDQTQHSWRTVWLLAAAVSLFGAVVWVIGGDNKRIQFETDADAAEKTPEEHFVVESEGSLAALDEA